MRTTQGGPHDYLDVDLNSIADLRRGRGGRTPDAVTSLSPKGFTSRRTLVTQSSIRMGDEHSPIRDLKHRWDEEDKTRDELERQARRAFFKQEANELFAPLENYLTRLDKVFREANAALEIDPTWEHLDERKLRRTAKVILRETAEHLSLDLTIEGVTIFYRNRPYRFTRAIEALIPVITSDVEQFITAQSQATTPAHLALIKGST
jgi:hypothetical protein